MHLRRLILLAGVMIMLVALAIYLGTAASGSAGDPAKGQADGSWRDAGAGTR